MKCNPSSPAVETECGVGGLVVKDLIVTSVHTIKIFSSTVPSCVWLSNFLSSQKYQILVDSACLEQAHAKLK